MGDGKTLDGKRAVGRKGIESEVGEGCVGFQMESEVDKVVGGVQWDGGGTCGSVALLFASPKKLSGRVGVCPTTEVDEKRPACSRRKSGFEERVVSLGADSHAPLRLIHLQVVAQFPFGIDYCYLTKLATDKRFAFWYEPTSLANDCLSGETVCGRKQKRGLGQTELLEVHLLHLISQAMAALATSSWPPLKRVTRAFEDARRKRGCFLP